MCHNNVVFFCFVFLFFLNYLFGYNLFKFISDPVPTSNFNPLLGFREFFAPLRKSSPVSAAGLCCVRSRREDGVGGASSSLSAAEWLLSTSVGLGKSADWLARS